MTYSLLSGFGWPELLHRPGRPPEMVFGPYGLCHRLSVSFFGLSVVLLTPITQSLLNSVGVPITFRTLSVIFLVLTAAAASFMKNPDKEYYYSEITKVILQTTSNSLSPLRCSKSPLTTIFCFPPSHPRRVSSIGAFYNYPCRGQGYV